MYHKGFTLFELIFWVAVFVVIVSTLMVIWNRPGTAREYEICSDGKCELTNNISYSGDCVRDGEHGKLYCGTYTVEEINKEDSNK